MKQSYPQLLGQKPRNDPKIGDGIMDTYWELIEAIFTILYCVEMTVKIAVFGFKRYYESFRNRFDAFITILTLAATVYVYSPFQAFGDSRLIRYIGMARVLRLTRLVAAVKQFQVIFRTFVDILPAANRVFLLLFCIMYCYAAAGIHFFGGLITRDPLNPISMRLEGTQFADNAYWANTFNDMMSG